MTDGIELAALRSRAAAMIPGMGSSAIRRVGIAALLGSILMGQGTPASADDVEPVHITYDAPARCPSESDFLDMVARDGGRFLQVSETLPVRMFLVHIDGVDPIKGRLIVRDPEGSDAVQEMVGAGCDEVVRSLAVLVALSLEPPPSTPRERDRSGPQPPPVADDATPPAVPGLAALPPWAESADPSPRYDESPASVPRPHGWRIDLSGEGTVSTGADPSWVPGFAAYGELLYETPSLLAPSLRVGAEISANQGNFAYSVHRFIGRLDACTFRARLARPWSDDEFTLEPCARVDVGRVEADAWVSSGPRVSAARLWLAPAGLLRLRWTSPRVFLEIEGGITFPLIRETFSSTTLGMTFTVPPIGATTGLGFGAYFL